MDEKKDSLVVKPYKDDVVSSIAIGILCILMGIIFPDDGMYMFWFSIALVIFRACSVANEILILSKDGVIVKRGKILNVLIIIMDIAIIKRQLFYRDLSIYRDKVYRRGFINLLIRICYLLYPLEKSPLNLKRMEVLLAG